MKEKWFVIVIHFQLAIVMVVGVASFAFDPPWLNPAGNNLLSIVFYWLFLTVVTPLFSYVAVKIAFKGFSYLGCAWAGDAPPARLDRDRRWSAVGGGIIIAVTSLDLALSNQPLLWKFTGWFAVSAGLMAILWGLDEYRRARVEPPSEA